MHHAHNPQVSTPTTPERPARQRNAASMKAAAAAPVRGEAQLTLGLVEVCGRLVRGEAHCHTDHRTPHHNRTTTRERRHPPTVAVQRTHQTEPPRVLRNSGELDGYWSLRAL